MSEPDAVKKPAEKGEKQEKDNEKQEKSRGEKNWDEKWRRDPLNAAVWAFILIWLGLTLLASNFEPFKGMMIQGHAVFEEWWRIFFAGAGCILLLEVLFRLLMPAYRAPVIGTFILAIVFIAIGIGEWIGNLWPILLPILLILGGVLVLFRGMFRKRE